MTLVKTMFRDVTTRAGGQQRLDPVAVARKIARHGLAPRTAARYATALLSTFEDVPAWDAGGQRVVAGILDAARTKGWTGRYALDPEKIRDMSKAELIAWSVREQPSEMQLRTAFALWFPRDPTGPDFEREYLALAAEARRQGWGLSEKARKASANTDAKEEGKPMVDRASQRVDEEVKSYMEQHPGVQYADAFMTLAETDAVGAYLPVAAPKSPALVRPEPWSQASVEVDRQAKAYSAKHEVSYDTALGAVFQADPGLRRDYLKPPTPSRQYGLIAEETYETLLAGLTREQLMELMVERKLSEPGLPADKGDTLAQIALYEWLTTTGGLEHGSTEAARERDRLWAEVVRRRFAKYGFSTPPGR